MLTIQHLKVFLSPLFLCHLIDASPSPSGAIISWRAFNTTPSGSIVTILIRQRYSWRRSFWPTTMCTVTTIASQTLIGSGTGILNCTVGSCGSFISISTDVPCTDFSSGERYDNRMLNIGKTDVVSYMNNVWFGLAIGGGGDWQMTGKIDLTIRPDSTTLFRWLMPILQIH